MEGDGRRIVYPPIHEVINRWGDLVYRVVLSDLTCTFDIGDGLAREEAHERVREILLYGLRSGRYLDRDFYPDGARSQRYAASHAAVDGHGLEVEEAHGRRCFGGTPASDEAIVGLPETSVKEGECGLCLDDFEAGNRLRTMPCAHSFHEDCIFSWLRLSHVCPLCRFALPTEQQDVV